MAMRCALACLSTLVLLAACAAPENAAPENTTPATDSAAVAPTAAELPTADSASAPDAPAGAFSALAAADCQAVRDQVAKAVGVDFSAPSEASYTDAVSGQSGTACSFEAEGTGVDFESPSAVMTQISTALTGAGWADDMRYLADGPTGTAAAFTQGASRVIASVEWAPSPDAKCPPDQPISACPLTPEQKNYLVQLYGVTGQP